MDFLASLFVNKPLHVLLVACMYLVVWVALRLADRRSNAMLVPAVLSSSTLP